MRGGREAGVLMTGQEGPAAGRLFGILTVLTRTRPYRCDETALNQTPGTSGTGRGSDPCTGPSQRPMATLYPVYKTCVTAGSWVKGMRGLLLFLIAARESIIILKYNI